MCPGLFGPENDKSVFRIFDHWGNFARFDIGYQPAQPTQGMPLAQLVFEERLTLAEAALERSEVPVFEMILGLVAADINALPEESIALRDKWREKRVLSCSEILQEFAPTTVARLRQDVAPLMQWRNIRGLGDALALDLLFARMQLAVVCGSGALGDLKIDLMDRLAALKMHLNPVREKAEIIKRVQSNAFWANASAADLEEARINLRDIMHHRARRVFQHGPPKVVDITEDAEQMQFARHSASLNSADMKAYRQIIEAELKQHFETDPVLKKIRAGEPVSDREIESLVSLILTQNPNVRRELIEEFFSETAKPLYVAIRSIVGMDPHAVQEKFTSFVQKHPKLSAKQTRFLSLLQNHIVRYGMIEVERLYDAPFTIIDAVGPDGVFENEGDLIDLIKIVRTFGARNRERLDINPNEGKP